MTDPTPAKTSSRRTNPAPTDSAAADSIQGGQETTAAGQPDVATYELARDELAAVVSKLESGGLSLDESITLWERGEHLATVCNRFLDGARERVERALARADEADPG